MNHIFFASVQHAAGSGEVEDSERTYVPTAGGSLSTVCASDEWLGNYRRVLGDKVNIVFAGKVDQDPV